MKFNKIPKVQVGTKDRLDQRGNDDLPMVIITNIKFYIDNLIRIWSKKAIS